MGKLVNSRIISEIEEKRDFFILTPEKELDFRAIFGNAHPVHLEIGSGRGEFIVSQALLEWQRNFIGVEVNSSRIDLTLRQLDVEHHRNVRLLNIYLDTQTIRMFPKSSVHKVYIIQPDPWPKRCHHKRRLINHNFLDILVGIMSAKAILEIQTDHEEYAHWILKILQERSDLIPAYEGVSRIPRQGHIVTYFEEKKMREGFSPLYISYRKSKETIENPEDQNGSAETE